LGIVAVFVAVVCIAVVVMMTACQRKEKPIVVMVGNNRMRQHNHIGEQ
jgi:hypothetical protein